MTRRGRTWIATLMWLACVLACGLGDVPEGPATLQIPPAPPPLVVPELEPVKVPAGMPVSSGQFTLRMDGGMTVAPENATLVCDDWGTHHALRGHHATMGEWNLYVAVGAPPNVWLVTEMGAWGDWEQPPSYDSLEVSATSARFDVALRPKVTDDHPDAALRLPVTVVGSMACPVLEGPNTVPTPLHDLLGAATGADVRPWSTFEFGRRKDPRGISVRVRASGLVPAVKTIRAALPPGWTAWIGTSRFVDEGFETWHDREIVIGPGGRNADIVRIAHVSPVNYGLDTESVVAQLEAWDDRVGVDVLQADVESLTFEIRSRPADPKAFAREVAEFCPDVISQGVGSEEALMSVIADTKTVSLWWD